MVDLDLKLLHAIVCRLVPPEKNPNNAGRPWTYQTCNEFGYFQTTDSPHQPFHAWKGLDMQFYDEMCKAGFEFTAKPQVFV